MADREEVQRVVWHTPTEYDALKHGPPYLPGVTYEPVKLSSEERAAVRSFVKKASRMAAGVGSPSLLAVLQAVAMLHQSHHWSTRGPAFYQDHLLFERLYNESLEFIDQLAERTVGLKNPPLISALQQAQEIGAILAIFGSPAEPEDMVKVSLGAETYVLQAIDAVFKVDGELVSHGISNLLEGVADKHESFVYLLQQRSQAVFAYTYDRR